MRRNRAKLRSELQQQNNIPKSLYFDGQKNKSLNIETQATIYEEYHVLVDESDLTTLVISKSQSGASTDIKIINYQLWHTLKRKMS